MYCYKYLLAGFKMSFCVGAVALRILYVHCEFRSFGKKHDQSKPLFQHFREIKLPTVAKLFGLSRVHALVTTNNTAYVRMQDETCLFSLSQLVLYLNWYCTYYTSANASNLRRIGAPAKT